MKKELSSKEILADNDNLSCTCPNLDCEWHGNCKDCIVLHRYYATIPNCLKLAIKEQKGIDVDYINED